MDTFVFNEIILRSRKRKMELERKKKFIIAVRNAFYGTFDSDPLSFMLASFRDIILNKNRRGVTKSKS